MSTEVFSLWIALASALTALASVLAPIIYDWRKRKFEAKMRQIEFRQTKDYEAIENYVRGVNLCIRRKMHVDEFSQSSISICLHIAPSLWGYIFAINEHVANKEYLEAENQLKLLCQELYLHTHPSTGK